MRISLNIFPRFNDARLQRLIEEEQTTLLYGLLSVIVEVYEENELGSWISELDSYSARAEWPKFSSARQLNLIMVEHLRKSLEYLADGTDFRELKSLVETFSHSLLQEMVEAFLSVFHEQLDTISLTYEDIDKAFTLYGKRSESGNAVTIGDQAITRETTRKIHEQLPRYVNAISTEAELVEAKQYVDGYNDIEKQYKGVNFDMSTGVMGYIKWIYPKIARSLEPKKVLQRLISSCQEKRFSDFGRRPISKLAIRIRDYLALQPRIASLSSNTLKALFRDINNILQGALISLMKAQNLVTSSGRLNGEISAADAKEAFRIHRIQIPTLLLKELSEKLTDTRDSLREWQVMIGLPNVDVKNGPPLPRVDHVSLLTVVEAEEWYNARKLEDWHHVNFSEMGGVAIIEQVSARDATRAAEISERRLRRLFDHFVFHYRHGWHNNPQMSPKRICIKLGTADQDQFWISIAPEQIVTELTLRHPNSAAEQTSVMNMLSKLSNYVEAGHPLAHRLDKSIYWYKKGVWSSRVEEKLLNYWISLEVLIGDEYGPKGIIPLRAGLLAPLKIPVDGHTTYGQLRSWTEEFIEDAYLLRNEIAHGGTFEGPVFDRFVDRFRSILSTIMFTIASPIMADLILPDNLEELLAWIWYKNPNTQVATVGKTS